MITDVATKLQDVIDGINHVLHPDAPVTKRSGLTDIAKQIEGIIGEITKVLTPTTKRDLIDVAKQIEGVIGEISKILTPGKTKTPCSYNKLSYLACNLFVVPGRR